MEEYRTLRGAGCAAFTEKKSRFLGAVAPVRTEGEALAFIATVKKAHWDARHNVSAYLLRAGVQHCTDDGEPQGTAGVPVLEVLRKSGLTDAVAVVTRYFGGVLLGAGGLVRAYSHAVSLAVAQAGVCVRRRCLQLRLCCAYSAYGPVAALLAAHGAVVDTSSFAAQVTLDFHLPPAALPALEAALAQATAGQVCPQKQGEGWYVQDSSADSN